MISGAADKNTLFFAVDISGVIISVGETSVNDWDKALVVRMQLGNQITKVAKVFLIELEVLVLVHVVDIDPLRVER